MWARLRLRALSLSTSSSQIERLGEVVVGSELEPGGLVVEPVGGGEHEDRHAAAGGPGSNDAFGDLVAGRAWDIAVEDGDVVDVDAQQFQRGVTVTGDVGGDRFQAQAIADGFCQIWLVLDDQHTHTPSMLRAGTYRPYIENRIRADNTTLSRLPACPTASQHESPAVVSDRPSCRPQARSKDAAMTSRTTQAQATGSLSSRFVQMFGATAQDVRHALRLIRREPAFTFTALATLALGIGLNTAIFSVAYGVLWRPLPYPNPDRLIIISSAQQTETGVKTFSTWPPVTYEGLRPRVTTLDHLAAYTSIDVQLTGRGEPLQLPALDVSPNFFATLGVSPARGRAFLTGAAAPDDDRAAIVSDRLWRTSLKADPAIVGQSITIDGLPRTVVGVLPPDFTFRPVIARLGALPDADIFLPNRWSGDTGRNASLFLLGRMKSGVTQERAEAELTALVNDPSIAPAGALTMAGAFAANARTLARAVSLQEQGTESVRPLLLILLGAVSFVLLIACVNVANLQMARLTARRGELSVRMALGAGRRRIVRQLLTEAVVLSLLGASLGVMLAWLAIGVTLPLVPQAVLPRLGGIVIDARVMVFCLGLSLVSTLLIGLVPALRVSGAAFGEGLALHAGAARTTGDRQGERLRTLLVAGQIAMTLVLLIGAGLLIHSFVRLTSVSTGLRIERARRRRADREGDAARTPRRRARTHPCVRARRARSHPVPAGRDVREPDQLDAVRQDVHPGRLRHRGAAEADALCRHAEDRAGLFQDHGDSAAGGTRVHRHRTRRPR